VQTQCMARAAADGCWREQGEAAWREGRLAPGAAAAAAMWSTWAP
jgi:hypothetical protein